jgi:hypothetical protein
VLPTYDQQTPFWFQRAWLVGAPFVFLMTIGGVYLSLTLVLLGVVPLLACMCAAGLWSHRHKVE